MNYNNFLSLYYNELKKILNKYELKPKKVMSYISSNDLGFEGTIKYYENWFDFMYHKYPEYLWFMDKIRLEINCKYFNNIEDIKEFLNELVEFYLQEDLLR